MAGALKRQAFFVIATLLCVRGAHAAGDAANAVVNQVRPSPAPAPSVLPPPKSILPVEAPHDAASESGITDEKLSLRDPFLRPPIELQKLKAKSELESYSIEEFKLIGVLTGPDRMRAMLVSPDGRTHIVGERMKIGVKNGYVRKITTQSVYVREKTLNVLGRTEELDSEIALLPDSRFKKKESEGEFKGGSDTMPPMPTLKPVSGVPTGTH